MLELVRLGLGEGALGGSCAALATKTDVLVVTDSILPKTLQDRVLIGDFGKPVFHALHHFALDLRVVVVEIWVEAR